MRVKFLGKKGELTAVLKGMKDVVQRSDPKVGQLVNETRAAIEELLEETKVKMEAAIREEKMKAEVIDVTLPSKKSTVGHRHPNTIALEEVERIFVGMGYEVVEGPEVEYDLYNFRNSTFRTGILQKMNRIHSISTKTSCFVPDITGSGTCDGTGASSRSV